MGAVPSSHITLHEQSASGASKHAQNTHKQCIQPQACACDLSGTRVNKVYLMIQSRAHVMSCFEIVSAADCLKTLLCATLRGAASASIYLHQRPPQVSNSASSTQDQSRANQMLKLQRSCDHGKATGLQKMVYLAS